MFAKFSRKFRERGPNVIATHLVTATGGALEIFVATIGALEIFAATDGAMQIFAATVGARNSFKLLQGFSQGFRKIFARFSRGFRRVFARLSLPKYFRERFRRAEKKINQFLRAAGALAPRRRRTGAPAARQNW